MATEHEILLNNDAGPDTIVPVLKARPARFRPAKNADDIADVDFDVDCETLTPVKRRPAVFRPSEHIAARRDLVERFVDACRRDAEFMDSESTAFERAILSSAFGEETLGRFDRAWRTIGTLSERSQSDPEVLAMRRRLARALEEEGLVNSNIEKSHLFERGTFKALSGLELAQNLWKANASVEEISKWLNRVVREFDLNREVALGKMSNFIASWVTLLSVDVALIDGDVLGAAGLLELLSEHAELPGSSKRVLRAMAANWFAAVGEISLAKKCFEVLDDISGLDPDTEESYLRVMFDLNDRENAAKFVRRHPFGSTNPRRRIVDAMTLQNGDAVQALLDAQDPETLHAHAALDLMRKDVGDEVLLIDTLNANLSNKDLSISRRVALLCELAHRYESNGNEAAAADVLREALEFTPDHAPAIRALGRLYHRTGEIDQLIGLYENEIAARSDEDGAWRRRFQVAQLYENESFQFEKALAHYVCVLKQRPNYLPALKGASRICEATGQWARIAGLFLEAVPHTNSHRQKIYLLDKVATLAEHHLSNDSAAIDAWEEILSLMPEHPNAHAALGRLYVRTQRWHDVLNLNLSETTLIDDEEEIATLFTRNGEIAEIEICDSTLAERFFRNALSAVPDFLPALEGLGRILTRTRRWEELVEMNRSQLEEIESLSERYRQTIILAEIFETRLRNVVEAESLYSYASRLDADSGFARINVVRLKKKQGKWADVYAIECLETDVSQGYLGYICEWKTADYSAAYSHYLKALHDEPVNLLWLDGVTRTWSAASIRAGELADELENLLLSPMDAQCRDAYFLALARLKEFEEKTPDASRAYRAHGDRTHFENRSVLRLSMGLSNETEALVQIRKNEPIFEIESLLVSPRHGMSDKDISQFSEAFPHLDENEKQWILRETEVQLVSTMDNLAPQEHWLGLVQQFGRVLSGEENGCTDVSAFSPSQRFLGIEAKENGDIDTFKSYINHEIDGSTSVDLRIRRQLELTKCVSNVERTEILSDVIAMFTEGEMPALNSGQSVLTVLEGFKMWEAFVELGDILLSAHVFEGDARVTLVRQIAEVEASNLDEKEGASKRYLLCWETSGSLADLTKLVELSELLSDRELACEYQQLHFGAIRSSEFENSERTLQARLVSGMKLATLLVDCEREADAIHLLEEMTHPKSEDKNYRKLISYLGRLHAKSGDARRAVSLLEEHLPITPGFKDVADWNTLVSTYLNVLGDLPAAYRLQWSLVRSVPQEREELEKLVEIAIDFEELEDCCEQLERFAESSEDDIKISILTFVAETYEEELFSSDNAVRIYSRLLDDASLVLDKDLKINSQRRRAFGLSKIVGQEQKAVFAFRALVKDEVYEPSTYRGMVDLFTKLQAFDRARCSEQILKVLGCDVDIVEFRAKQNPSREAGLEVFAKHVFPEELSPVFNALRALMPLAEKLWDEELPQRKAISGDRVRGGTIMTCLEDGFSGFGIKKFRALIGDAGPLIPQVIPDGTVWFNSDLLENSTQSEVRFYTAYAAAIAWTDLSSVLSLDGRELWHLLEGVLYKQNGVGFSDRIDAKSQEFSEIFSSAFYAVARRRIVQAMDPEINDFSSAYCEAWPQNIRTFAIRYAVAICGDVYASVSALLKMTGWEGEMEEAATQTFIRRDAQIQDLLNFVNSDSYYQLRYALGLSGKPSLS